LCAFVTLNKRLLTYLLTYLDKTHVAVRPRVSRTKSVFGVVNNPQTIFPSTERIF